VHAITSFFNIRNIHFIITFNYFKAEICSGRGIKYNKSLEQLLRRAVLPDNLDYIRMLV
jgi:hypothetical protein